MNFFKKLIRALTKILKSGHQAQAAIEYFIILGVVTLLIILSLPIYGGQNFYQSFNEIGEELFQKSVNGILGD